MGGDVVVRVLAEQACLDLDGAVVAIAVGGKLGDFLVRQTGADGKAFGVARLGEELPEAGTIARGDLATLRGKISSV
jgi:hypothetical protein